MIAVDTTLFFGLAALIMVLTPGPNMVYLISRSLSQGKRAGIISLMGVVCGFLFHVLMVSFGLTAIFFSIPYAFFVVKTVGVTYLLYLAYGALKSGKTSLSIEKNMTTYKPFRLFNMGLLTNVLNPKMAVFYISLFPQFIDIHKGSVLAQSLQLGLIQIVVSFIVNFIIVISAAKMATFISGKPLWIKLQKWFMASVLTGLAVKLAFAKAK